VRVLRLGACGPGTDVSPSEAARALQGLSFGVGPGPERQ